MLGITTWSELHRLLVRIAAQLIAPRAMWYPRSDLIAALLIAPAAMLPLLLVQKGALAADPPRMSCHHPGPSEVTEAEKARANEPSPLLMNIIPVGFSILRLLELTIERADLDRLLVTEPSFPRMTMNIVEETVNRSRAIS